MELKDFSGNYIDFINNHLTKGKLQKQKNVNISLWQRGQPVVTPNTQFSTLFSLNLILQ